MATSHKKESFSLTYWYNITCQIQGNTTEIIVKSYKEKTGGGFDKVRKIKAYKKQRVHQNKC